MSATTTLRISAETHRRISELAKATGRQMQTIVEEAVSRYERALFWDVFELTYERLAENEAVWSDVQAERRVEAGALRDGLQ